MKKTIKTCFLILLLSMLFSLTTFAADKSSGGKIVQTGDGDKNKGQNQSENVYTQDGDRINVNITKKGGKYTYHGEANRGKDGVNHYTNPVNLGSSMEDMLRNAGVSQGEIDRYKTENGIFQDSNGLWRMTNGNLINFVDIANLIGQDPDDPVSPYVAPTIGQEPPVPGGWQKNIWDYKYCLLNGDMNGSASEVGTPEAYHEYFQGTEVGASFTPFSFALPSGDAEFLYNSAGRTKSNSWQEPEWIVMNSTYTGNWAKVLKYQFKKYHPSWDEPIDTDNDGIDDDTVKHPAYWEYSPVKYVIVSIQSASASLSWSWTPYYPEYTERKPIDLTTESAYNGTITIADKHGYEFKSPSGIGSAVNCSVSKEGLIAGEMLTLVANNNPVKFSVDFKDTWYGFEQSENLTGALGPDNGHGAGFQFVNWVKFYYGADKDMNSRSPKISSLSISMNSGSEELGPILSQINSGGGVGESDFYLRNIQENQPGDYYNLGESGNNVWFSIGRVDRNNEKGVDWAAEWLANPGINAGITNQNYTKIIIFDMFKQPVLYGEYDSQSAVGR